MFTGRRVDILNKGSLKLQYNRNRYYDQYTGRWLTHDPLGINPTECEGNPSFLYEQDDTNHNLDIHPDITITSEIYQPILQSEGFEPKNQYMDGPSLYEYVRSNPVTYMDPNGTDIYLEKKGTFHQDVCADLWMCSIETGVKPIRFGEVCFSFGKKRFGWLWPSSTWLGWPSWNGGGILVGAIYGSKSEQTKDCSPYSGHIGTVVKRKHTTVQQDIDWVTWMLNIRVDTEDTYSLVRHNCMKYSQMEFADAP